MDVNGMDKVSKAYHAYLKAIKEEKEAQVKFEKGEICSGEFFDIEFNKHETEQEFIDSIKKVE